MLERGTFSILYTRQIPRSTLRPLLPKPKASVANKTELYNKNASQVVCMHIPVMAQLSQNVRVQFSHCLWWEGWGKGNSQ